MKKITFFFFKTISIYSFVQFNIRVMSLNYVSSGCHNDNQKTNLDFLGFQTMTLGYDKNRSMLLKEKKRMVDHGINQVKMYIPVEITL